MLERLFDRITRGSIRFRWVTIGLFLIIFIAGIFAVTQLKQELIPSVEFPQTVVLALNPGADRDTMLQEVTLPLEEVIRPIEGVVNIESTTSNGVAYLIVLSEFGLDQEAIRDTLRDVVADLDYPDGMDIPEILSFSFADLPIASISVSSENLTLDQLKALVESEIEPQLMALDGVARVDIGGGQVLPPEGVVAQPTSEPQAEPTPESTEEPAGVALPDSWVQAAAMQGQTLETTADLTPNVVEAIVGFAPEMLDDLTPAMLLAMSDQALAAMPQDYLAGLDPELQAQLAERIGVVQATPETEPVPLPDSWVQGAAAQGQTLETTDDLNAAVIQGFVAFAPEMLADLTPEMLLAAPADAIAALPEDYLAGLDPELQATLAERVAALPAEGETPGSGEAPELSGAWRMEAPEDSQMPPLTFETAADLSTTGFADTASGFLNLMVQSGNEFAPFLIGDLTPDVVAWLIENEDGFLENLDPSVLRLMSQDVLSALPSDFMASLSDSLRAELEALASGTATVFVPTDTLNRVNGNPSLSMAIYQDQEANTVSLSHEVFDLLEELENGDGELRFDIVFEQASFIEESIDGVTREGALGAIFAVIVILFFLSGRINGKFMFTWRSTAVTAVSIPLSVMMAFVLFKWLPPALDPLLAPLADSTSDIPVLGAIFAGLHSLFPVGLTLNIMTLSGMTVAVGRVVDDSIVVLENIYRHIQRGENRLQSVLVGTRDVSLAIFASTATTVVVFLPIGLVGGMIGAFFLPFGIAVTYALASSFIVAVTIVPLLAYLFIRKEHLPPEGESALQRRYPPILKWALNNRLWTLLIATVLLVGSLFLFSTRPRAFLPDFGEVTISVNVDLPGDVRMFDTNEMVLEFEDQLNDIEGIDVVLTEIGSGGLQSRMLGTGVDQSQAALSIGIQPEVDVETLTAEIRQEAEAMFGADYVTVSSGTLSSAGFGGFSLVASGPPELLEQFNDVAIQALNDIDGLANASSNLVDQGATLRVDGVPAISFSGELETDDTLGLTEEAKATLIKIAPEGVTISEGFETRQQTEGFAQAIEAMGISVIIVYIVMVLTFHSFVHPFTILFSLPLAVIGAALALWITNSILGLSSLVGMMMLVGIVVTNAIVLVDRVQTNHTERGMSTRDSLMEAGKTRLRPILMTALAAILALVPLAVGLSEGAIIASELAIVVIGGLTTSTLLTLVVVPVMYSLLDRFSRNNGKQETEA
ncbi:MAG: efflux RND transporter permease subunit [Anaerolineales bacterium]|jgi:HAE1 family hydrophobic/amphiphilic exporter-1